jgi:signal peptidase I
MRPTFREILATLLIALVIFLGVQTTLESRVVEGFSMEPSLHGKLPDQSPNRLLVTKTAYWFGDPQRGDVIIFDSPVDPNRTLVKRVIALPGEEVEIKDGQVYITDINSDTFPLDEPYIMQEPCERDCNLSKQVPDDHYFVLGDNRNSSSDSRSWGTLPEENIIGKAWLIYWPLSNWHLISGMPLLPDGAN